MKKLIPGTNMQYANNDNAFETFSPLFEITGGLSLGQICSITGLQASTIQNWVKRGYVARPVNKKYLERHLSRILLISSLRDCINIEEIGELMTLINGDTEDESDDIVSESKLYDYFCRSVWALKSLTIDDKKIEGIILEELKNESNIYKKRLLTALKVMVYAYLSGECNKNIDKNLKELKK